MFSLDIDWQGCTEEVPVDIPHDLRREDLEAMPAWVEWTNNLKTSLAAQNQRSHAFHKSPIKLKKITVKNYDRFGRNLGFVKLEADMSRLETEGGKVSEGPRIPGIVFLRGPSVAMLVMLIPEDAVDESDRYVLLTVQPRIPVGDFAFVELPAGMIDPGDGNNFVGAAAREIKEELGIEINEEAMINLSELAGQLIPQDSAKNLPRAMYPSPGGCDEHMPIYAYEHQVTRANLKAYEGKFTGERHEGEYITLKVIKMNELWLYGSRDAKALAAVALWNGLRDAGKLPTSLSAARASRQGHEALQRSSKPASTSSK